MLLWGGLSCLGPGWIINGVIGPLLLYAIFRLFKRKAARKEGVASFERRLLAYGLDIVIINAILVVLAVASAKMQHESVSLQVVNPFFTVLVLGVLHFADMIVLPAVTDGRSLGKRIAAIKIVRKDGQKAGMFDLFCREYLKGFFSTLPVFQLGFLWMLVGKEQLTWYDSMMNTRVVDVAVSAHV
ncbi:MAG: RDD family protein [Pseudomonadota bacterium]